MTHATSDVSFSVPRHNQEEVLRSAGCRELLGNLSGSGPVGDRSPVPPAAEAPADASLLSDPDRPRS